VVATKTPGENRGRSFLLTPREDFSRIALHKSIPFFTSPTVFFSPLISRYPGEINALVRFLKKWALYRRTSGRVRGRP
jgi:hypothetical protein